MGILLLKSLIHIRIISVLRVEERSGRMSMGSEFKPPEESDADSMGDYGDEGISQV